MASSHNPIEHFDEHVPSDFVQDTVRCLIDTYRTAWDECRASYPWPEAHDLLGDMRRAKFESQWREVAKRYPTLKATAETNATGNCFHTVVVSGPVIITASRVQKQDEIVKDAIFRQTYARSCQRTLFEAFEPEQSSEPPPDAPLYAILIHAPAETRSVPWFAHIVFPSPDCREYLGRIRLEERFPELFGTTDTIGVEDVQDEAQVHLRDDIEKRDRKNA